MVDRRCIHCGSGARELRPYGPDGADVCFPCAVREIERLRARVSEADELRARAEASVASMSAEMTAARELIGVQWWLLEHPLCGSRSFMDGLRRAFEARERDARLGAVVQKRIGGRDA